MFVLLSMWDATQSEATYKMFFQMPQSQIGNLGKKNHIIRQLMKNVNEVLVPLKIISR